MRNEFKRFGIVTARSIPSVAALTVALVVVLALVLGGHVTRGQERSIVVDAEVRIAAQRLENGDIRFGLRAQDGDGGWTAPVTPRAHRLDPANATIGRWLVSSPLTLEVDETGSGRLVPSDQFGPLSGGEVELVSGVEGWAGDARYSAYHDANGDLVTSAAIYTASVGAPDGELRTTITCQDGEKSVSIGGLPNAVGGDPDLQIQVTWSVDNGTRHSERRPVTSTASGLELVPGSGSRLAEALLGYGSQLALSVGSTPAFTTDIDLGAIRALPIYNNLRFCDGDAVQSGRTELRIRAQVRADQRIEFAVQQRTDDGWSDNILPRARVIAAFGEAGNWLSSTPVTVRVVLEPPLAVILPELAVRQMPEPITPVIRGGYRNESLAYGVYMQDVQGFYPTKLSSVVAAFSEQDLQLEVGCLGNERRVSLSGAPSDATGELTLSFDGRPLIAEWSVTRGDGSVSLSPIDSERTIQRLREARSLSVALGSDGAASASFDLEDLFETPIQTNIDQCGSYTEPQWRPVISGMLVQNDLGEYYAVAYSDGDNRERVSQVRVIAIGGTPAAGVARVNLVVTCGFRGLKFNIWGLPDVGHPPSIGLQVDNGEWYREPVSLTPKADGSSTAEFSTDLARLKQGRTLRFEVGLDPPVRGSFDLTNLLGTPIQANLDNCDRDYWPTARNYVPVVVSAQWSSRHLSYEARSNEDGTVFTAVQLTAADTSEVDGTFTMEAYCVASSGFQMNVGVPLAVEPGQIDVTLTIDDRPADISAWIATMSGTGGDLHPPSNARLMAKLRSASVVIVEAPELFAAPITFHVRGMFDTPVQGNLDECGYYKPGEARPPPPPVNANDAQRTYDADRDLTVIRFWERVPGVITPSTITLEQHYGDDGLVIGLSISCGGFGPRLSIYGARVGTLLADHVQVEWRTDEGPTRRQTWTARPGAASSSISPPKARAIIDLWRSASELEFTLSGASSDTHHFDLDTMFGVPVIDTFDACIDTPIPSQSPLVTGISVTTSGELTFAADMLQGSEWLSSYVRVPDSGEAPAEPDAPDTRSSLFIACTIDGAGLWVVDLDSAETTLIFGESVGVTWTIDGRTQDETWNAWTQVFSYAITPMDHMAFYETLRGARTLTIRLDSDPPISRTYELARHGFWDTPVQPNLDSCGD